jgi:hypothetical protein
MTTGAPVAVDLDSSPRAGLPEVAGLNSRQGIVIAAILVATRWTYSPPLRMSIDQP